MFSGICWSLLWSSGSKFSLHNSMNLSSSVQWKLEQKMKLQEQGRNLDLVIDNLILF